MHVSIDKHGYFAKETPFETEKSLSHPLKVEHQDDGYYVTLLVTHQWTAEHIGDDQNHLIPVAGFTEAYDSGLMKQKRFGTE